MSQTTIDFTHIVNGVPTNATSVVFADPTATFGLQRKDNLAIVIPADTPLERTGTGVYTYTFTDPASDLIYRYYLKVVYGSQTVYYERETSLTQLTPLTINGRYATYAGMRAKYGTSNLQKWASVDGSENQAAIIEALTAAINAADNYVDSFLLGGPYVVPFVGNDISPIIRECANILAGVILYETQGIFDTQATGELAAEAVGRFKTHRQMAMRTLARIKIGDIQLMGANGQYLSNVHRAPSAGVSPRLAYINGEPVYIEDDFGYIPESILKFY